MSRRWWALLLVLVLLAVPAGGVSAHGGEDDGRPWYTWWSTDPLLWLGLAGAALVYRAGWRRLYRSGRNRNRLRRQARAFTAGLLVTALALVSPLEGFAGELFWVHMLQHMLLVLAAAPLIVLSLPLPALLLGLPAALSRAAGGLAREGGLKALVRLMARPASAWLISAVVFWVWHAPALYQASLEREWVHALQHVSFLASALLFWWAALHTLVRSPEQGGLGVLYLFTTALHSGLLGALLTFSSRPWYPLYEDRAARWGLTGLEDQQLAGLVMWIPGGVIYLAAALWLLSRWLEGARSPEGEAPPKEAER